MTKHLLVASWCAVSSEPQAEKESLAEQRAQNHAFVANLSTLYPSFSGEIVLELQVVGSRSIIELEEACQRYPAYARLVDLIRTSAIDAVVCRSRDRLGRTDALIVTIESLCTRHGVSVIARQNPPVTLDPKYSWETESSGLVAAIEGHIAASSVRRLVNDHTMGMIGRVTRGNFAGRIPWGYVVKYNEEGTGIIAVDPQPAQVIRDILLNLYVNEKLSLRAIAAHLNSTGAKPPQADRWVSSSIEKIIKNADRYAGYVYVNRNSIRGRPYTAAQAAHPLIITEDELHAVRVEESRRHPKRPLAQGPQSIIAGSVFCSFSQAQMHVSLNNGIVTFRCTECSKQGRRNHSVSESKVIHAVCEHLRALEEQPEPLMYLQQLYSSARQEKEQQITPIQSQLMLLERQQKMLLWAYLNREVVDGSFDTSMKEITEKKGDLYRQLAAVEKAFLVREDSSVIEALRQLGLLRKILSGELDGESLPAQQWLSSLVRVYVGTGKLGRYAQNVEKVVYI